MRCPRWTRPLAGGRGGVALVLACAVLLGACSGGDSGQDAAGAVPLFSFVVLADPHVYGDGDAAARLEACVTWANARAASSDVELVLVAGDLGRAGQAKAILDGLTVPYVPILGDNAVQSGREKEFEDAFAAHFADLASVLDEYTRPATPVLHPQTGADAWLQNVAFTHRGVRFLGLDWCTRAVGETADLHEFPGGTWPFFAAQVRDHARGKRERVVMVSHHPMHSLLGGAGSFSGDELRRIESVTGPRRDWVFANFAGHYHLTWSEMGGQGGYAVYVTDATWDDDNTLRHVRVLDAGDRFVYTQQLIVVE